MARLLATLLHISDLHIGDIDPGSGDADVSPLFAATYRNFTWLDGLLGHEGQALLEVEQFLEAELRAKGEEPQIIVTGDFTRAGSASELGLAQQFVESAVELRPPPAQKLAGLGAGPLQLKVAGNHDHWGGTPPPAGGAHSIAWPALGLSPPSVQRPPLLLANGRRVVFIMVDSEADVAPRTPHRALAIGDFMSQLQRSLPLQPPAPEEIRVLLIHHSWVQAGWTLRMGAASKAALGALLHEHGVHVILTGHSHEPWLAPFVAAGPGGSRTVYELRCGTTTQYSTIPKNWFYRLSRMSPFPLQPQRSFNTLLLHRLIERDDGQTWWEAAVYARGDTGAFVPLQDIRAALNFPV